VRPSLERQALHPSMAVVGGGVVRLSVKRTGSWAVAASIPETVAVEAMPPVGVAAAGRGAKACKTCAIIVIVFRWLSAAAAILSALSTIEQLGKIKV
jgi:hypothetical protein